MVNFGFEALASVPGGLNYLGTWNATTNTPTITSGVGTPGDYYIVDVAGTTSIDGINDWQVGDWIIFSTSGVWQKIDNSDLEGYNLIQDEGVSLTKRSTIDFKGEGVIANDDLLNSKTIVTIPGTVNVDNISITGNGSVANPLVVTGSSSYPSVQVVLFADLATTERLNPCTYNNGALGVGATLTGNSNGQLSTISFTGRIDSVVTALNQTILVWNQQDQKQNGLYVVTQLGDASTPFILTRSVEADTQAEIYPLQVNIYSGATLSNRAFLQKTVDPVIGTNNIVFTSSTIGIQTSPLNFVDTATSSPLPSCTYTNGTNPALPGIGARLTATANGSIGTINGIALAVNNRILVKDQVNQAQNGDYTVTQVGSATQPFILTRFSAWGGEFPKLVREWKVNNPSSTKYGARYSTDLLSLANTAVGTTNIVFTELLDINTNIYNTDGTLAGNRTVTMAGNTLNLSGGNVGINTTPTQLLDVNGVTRHRGNVNMDAGAGIIWNDLTGIVPTSVNSRIRWTLNNDSAEIYAWQTATDDIDLVFKLTDNTTDSIDNYVFWMDGFGSEATDAYPLEMNALQFIVNPLRRYATLPANANSGNTDFYVLKQNATGLTDSLIFGDVSATRVGINTSSPTETLDVNGKTKTTTFQMTTAPVAGYVLTSDASGNGTWQTPSGSSSGRFGIADSNGAYTYYTTLQAAITAASAGQTVEMFADVIETGAVTVTLKNGVNINGQGHTYTLNNGTVSAFTGASIECQILDLRIIHTGTSTGVEGYTVNLSGNNTRIDFNGSYIYRNLASDTGSSSALYLLNSNGTILNAYCISETSTAIRTNGTNNSLLFNCYGETRANSSNGIESPGRIQSSIGIATTSSGIFGSNAGTRITNCTGISTSNNGIRGNASNSTSISTSGASFSWDNCEMINCSFISSTGSAVTGAGNQIINGYLESSGAIVSTSTGTSKNTFYNCVLVSRWANASAHVLQASGTGTIITNSTLQAGSSTANCINSLVASTVSYANNTFSTATTPVNANVTQGIVNTQDNQGNILL